jgi:hypothetical protein
MANGVLYLTAKDKICFLERRECNPEACPYAKGHYDRVNDVLYTMLQNEDVYNREVIERYAREHKVCPFELGLDLTLWSDCIIADYNYVFDPQAYSGGSLPRAGRTFRYSS